MPAPNLSVDWIEFDRQNKRLQSLIGSVSSLAITHQKLVAEIVMIRVFFLVENTIQAVCAKILCGATYLDLTSPRCLITARSSRHAFDLMKNHGRTPPKRALGWTQSQDIRENLANTLDVTDPIFACVVAHAGLLTDMRYVRNHIAHKNDGSRRNFHMLIKKHYGGMKPGVTPGSLLLSALVGPSVLLQHYLAASRVFVKLLVRA